MAFSIFRVDNLRLLSLRRVKHFVYRDVLPTIVQLLRKFDSVIRALRQDRLRNILKKHQKRIRCTRKRREIWALIKISVGHIEFIIGHFSELLNLRPKTTENSKIWKRVFCCNTSQNNIALTVGFRIQLPSSLKPSLPSWHVKFCKILASCFHGIQIPSCSRSRFSTDNFKV